MRKRKRKGLVHVYTGEGKGKTSASVGLATRALGHGLKVYMIQFLKGGGHSGEYLASKEFLPNFTIKQFGKPCPYSEEMKKGTMECGNCKDCFLSRREEREKVSEGLELAEKIVKSGKYDVVILDEINNAVSRKLTSVSKVVKLIRGRKSNVELILTGRHAPKDVIDDADYVTEMKRIKHPFMKGVRVRHGIDY
ncbi:MAG: cob(I)yrinic acid a,c-diamide adenosyltransferase [Candidatus Altiarchaeales archaeon]|nr:cob(I)yrinic acid a,c-diamide adenosyltransferase [Candidatus Altiarchaeales archaeon]MBD3416758.1 cob(I)yrinic acid a,c-diamide adenosyltransferase [Candidatus Altiarchaeales archaeon]